MNSTPVALHTSALTSLPLLARGKVRDNYAVGDDRILMVASDRLSAFDVIMGEPIPGKGELLTQMALFWFDKLGHICPNHLTGEDPKAWSRPPKCPSAWLLHAGAPPAAHLWSRPWCAAIWPAVAGRSTRPRNRCGVPLPLA